MNYLDQQYDLFENQHLNEPRTLIIKSCNTQLCQLCKFNNINSSQNFKRQIHLIKQKQTKTVCETCFKNVEQDSYTVPFSFKVLQDLNQFSIIFKSKRQIYNLKIGECQICFENKNLYQISEKCDHFYCSQCIKSYLFQTAIERQQVIINCLNSKCQSIISEQQIAYFIDQYILHTFISNQWFLVCPNNSCKNMLSVNELGNFYNEKIIIENDGRIRCQTCKKVYCSNCRQKYHINNCDFEKLFSNNMKKLKIFRCPKCSVYLQRERFLCGKDGECPLCGLIFCNNCKQNLQLFSQENWHSFQCSKCTKTQNCEKEIEQYLSHPFCQFIISIFTLLICIIPFLIFQLYEVAKYLCKELKFWLSNCPIYAICLLSPFIFTFFVPTLVIAFILELIKIIRRMIMQ